MSDDKFTLPKIPALHVPVYVPVRNDPVQKPIQTTTNSHVTAPADDASGDSAAAARSLVTNFPKLCPQCSASLLQYLQPLQLYINQLVTITSGMADQCEHVQIINKMQELPQIMKLSQVPGGRTRPDPGPGATSQPQLITQLSSSPSQQQQQRPQSRQPRHQNLTQSGSNDSSAGRGHEKPGTRSDESRGGSSPSGHSRQQAGSSNATGHRVEHRQYQQHASHQQQQGHGQRSQGQSQVTHNAPTGRTESAGHQQQPVSSNQQHQHHAGHPHTGSPKVSEASGGQQAVVNNSQDEGTASQTSHTSNSQDHERDSSHETRHDHQSEEAHETGGDSEERPFAFVTIVYDNLSAINAIILCNSVSLSCTKQVRHNDRIVQIPFVAIIIGHVSAILKEHLADVFDEVFFENRDARLSMLMDESFGVSQVKIQLWKRLSGFEKCFFIESTSLVVGNIDDVFIKFNELSACVDWMFPDSFSCAVFVFEPRTDTYNQLMKYAIDMVQDNDDPEVPPADDMTILNQFFASKWVKMSFIYNYSQNTAMYTQQPAFAKFGGAIRIVNFDFTPISGHPGHQGPPTSQPWHVSFDLNRSTQMADVSTHHQVNNYVRFYLNIFLKRVWPLIRTPLTPLLLARNKTDWSIYELIALLKNPNQDLDQTMPYSPIILRRRDPTFQYNAEDANARTVPDSPGHQKSEDVKEDTDDDNDDQVVPESEAVEQLDPIDEEDEEAVPEDSADPDTKSLKQQVLVPDRQSDRRIWESGTPDWIGAHGSDKLIDRLKDKFK